MTLSQLRFLSDAAESVEESQRAYNSYTIKSQLAHALITELPHHRLVFFRGTDDILDWFTDARIKLVEYPKHFGLYVHAGMLESMLSIRSKLIDEMKARPPKPTIIGGHSKGGGEARIFMYSLAHKHNRKWVKNIVASHTFGEPRTLGRGASFVHDRVFGDITYRWVHEEDCVPRMPWLLGRYRHAGQLAFLQSGGGYYMNPSLVDTIESDVGGMYKAYQARSAGAFDEPIVDHFIANYVSAIDQLN